MPADPQNPNRNIEGEDYLSPSDIRHWAEREIANTRRAASLREKELNDLSNSYSAGKLTPEQADEAHSRYHHRWGEALPDAMPQEHLTDEQVVQAVDNARPPFVGPKQLAESFRKRFKTRAR